MPAASARLQVVRRGIVRLQELARAAAVVLVQHEQALGRFHDVFGRADAVVFGIGADGVASDPAVAEQILSAELLDRHLVVVLFVVVVVLAHDSLHLLGALQQDGGGGGITSALLVELAQRFVE